MRQCNRSKRPATVAPSCSGTSSEPAMEAPCTCTAVPRAAGARISFASAKSEPSRRSRRASTSIRRSGSEASPRSPDTTPIQSSASSRSTRPSTTSPCTGGASASPPPSRTRTPVCCGVLRLRSDSRSPSFTATSPRSIGRFTSTVDASACAAGLRTGSGRSIAVPTRFERSCSRVGGALRAAPCGIATATVHGERPSMYGFSHSRLPALSSRSSMPMSACSSASNACFASRTCGAPARSESRPGAPSCCTCRRSATNPSWSYLALPRTSAKASFQRCSRIVAPARSTPPCMRSFGAPSSWNGNSMWKSALAGPATCRLSITSPCSLCSGLCRSIARNALASPAAFASTLSSARPKRGMPALNALIGTPPKRPEPAMVKPSASKRMSPSTCSIAGQSGWNLSLPPSIRASMRNLPAPARPGSLRNGQSSRSPATTAWMSRRVPPCSAASSHCTVDFGIRWWIQKPCAADTRASPMSAAMSRCGRPPSLGKPMPPRAFAFRSLPAMARPGVRTVQPAPSRQSTASPSRANSWTTPKPAGQSNATCAFGSKRRRRPSASPSKSPSTPRMPGAVPTGAKCSPRMRALACSGPPRAPRTSTSSSTAPAAESCSQRRRFGVAASVNASSDNSGAASMRCARNPNCPPPTTASPSSTCSPSPLPMRRRAASARHCRTLPRQRASSCSCPSTWVGAASPACIDAPRRATSLSAASACRATTRPPSSSPQVCTRPRPEVGVMPASANLPATSRRSALRVPA